MGNSKNTLNSCVLTSSPPKDLILVYILSHSYTSAKTPDVHFFSGFIYTIGRDLQEKRRRVVARDDGLHHAKLLLLVVYDFEIYFGSLLDSAIKSKRSDAKSFMHDTRKCRIHTILSLKFVDTTAENAESSANDSCKHMCD